jgi:purine nucleoside phosphorylase
MPQEKFNSFIKFLNISLKSVINEKLPTMGILLGSGISYKCFDEAKLQILRKFDFKSLDVSNYVINENSNYDLTDEHLIVAEYDNMITLFIFPAKMFQYENYNALEVSFPIMVLNALNIKDVIIHGAVGGLRSWTKKGNIFTVSDIANFTGDNALRYLTIPNKDKFVDMANDTFNEKMTAIFNKYGNTFSADYVAVHGPALETLMEYKFYRLFSDVIGMSLYHEITMCNYYKMNVLAICHVTDDCSNMEYISPVDLSEMQNISATVETKLIDIFDKFFRVYLKNKDDEKI